jgi:hypothetical protein
MEKSFTDQLRQSIRDSELTRYAISKQTGIDQAVLCRFISGECGMSLESVDRLMKCLNLKIKGKVKKNGHGFQTSRKN